jgi:hypothetical protein
VRSTVVESCVRAVEEIQRLTEEVHRLTGGALFTVTVEIVPCVFDQIEAEMIDDGRYLIDSFPARPSRVDRELSVHEHVRLKRRPR